MKRLSFRRVVAVAAVLLAGSAVAPPGPAGAAPPPRSPAPVNPSAVALAEAKRTGKSVAIDALTTQSSVTTADPAGTFTVSQAAAPVRKRVNGQWHDLDATLHRNPDGTVAPALTATALTLSGGGNTPLATMTADAGRSLSLDWPAALPAPVLSGSTATYLNVLPDVDLVVTAQTDGGFSDVLVVKTAAAAADPRLSIVAAATRTTGGLTLIAGADGTLRATATATGEAVFAAAAPRMWDSSGGSTVDGPGQGARVARMTPRIAGNGLTLTPDRTLLTGPSTVYPLYLDPTWTSPGGGGGTKQAWAQVDTIDKGAAHWKPTVLQNGFCGWDGSDPCVPSHFTARSFLRMAVPPALQGATILSSTFYLTVTHAPYNSCSSAPNPGLELWWSGAISSSTTWNSQPGWLQKLDTEYPAACDGQRVGFPVSSFMVAHAQGNTNMTFGIRASNESNKDSWKKINASTVSMQTTYNHIPNGPGSSATAPGGACTAGAVVGNGDVTLQTKASDPDNGNLGVEFVVKDKNGAVVYDNGDPKPANNNLTVTSGAIAQVTLTRDEFAAWNTGLTAPYTYTWYARISDGRDYNAGTGTGSAASPCGFTFDASVPTPPSITPIGAPVTLGTAVQVTVAAGSGATPARYVYQLNDGPPAYTSTGGASQTLTITPHRVGTNTLRVSTLSAGGNPSPAEPISFTVLPPEVAHAYADADVDGDGKSDLLIPGGTAGTGAGLWLATTDGAGGPAAPVNIGAYGTGASSTRSPSDWAGAQVLHGDFTGDRVQDVVAYYRPCSPVLTVCPRPGVGTLMYGNGDSTPLDPASDSPQSLPVDLMGDETINDTANDGNGDYPVQLVAAGNASGMGNSAPDLIGIAGDGANAGNYELNLYTGAAFTAYGITQTLAGPAASPDGLSDWGNFTLADAPLKNTLYALKATTGELWQSTDLAATWTRITTPSGWPAFTVASGNTVLQADITAAGAVELWVARNGGTSVTPYTIGGSALTAGTAATLTIPTHQWPLTDAGTSTAADTASTPLVATLAGGATLGDASGFDQIRGNVATLDGHSGYLRLPDGTIQNTPSITLSLMFRAEAGTTGIILSTGHDTPDKLNSQAMPLAYLGTDGRIYAQFWNGVVRPMTSSHPVNDGQWHTLTLQTSGTDQSLYLDDYLRLGMAGSPTVSSSDPETFVGAGVFSTGHAWINAPGDTTKVRASYFTGQIANVLYYSKWLNQGPQLDPLNKPATQTGLLGSGVSASLCIDDSGSTANGSPVTLHTCDATNANQMWNLNPDHTITINSVPGRCLDITGAGTANGTKLELYACVAGAVNQQWNLESAGQIWNPNSKRCIDDPNSSTTVGTQLQIYDCNLTNAQTWKYP
jgi:hypothetical protein